MFSGIFCFWGVKDQSFFPLNEKLLCFLFHVRLFCRSYTVKEVCPPLQNRAAAPSFSVIAHSFYTTFAEEFDIQVSFPEILSGIPTLPNTALPAKFGCDLFCCVTAGAGTGAVGQDWLTVPAMTGHQSQEHAEGRLPVRLPLCADCSLGEEVPSFLQFIDASEPLWEHPRTGTSIGPPGEWNIQVIPSASKPQGHKWPPWCPSFQEPTSRVLCPVSAGALSRPLLHSAHVKRLRLCHCHQNPTAKTAGECST